MNKKYIVGGVVALGAVVLGLIIKKLKNEAEQDLLDLILTDLISAVEDQKYSECVIEMGDKTYRMFLNSEGEIEYERVD